MMAENSFLSSPARNKWLALLILCGLLLGISACGGGEETPPPPVPITAEQVTIGSQFQLACTQSCAERAQCGINQNGTQVVLMKNDAPAVDNQNMAIPVGTIATVQEGRVENLREITTGFVFPEGFYRLSMPDQVPAEGWVPLWCLAQQ